MEKIKDLHALHLFPVRRFHSGNHAVDAKLDLAISHTHDFVVAAVATNARVGVDVERASRDLSEEFTHGVFLDEFQFLFLAEGGSFCLIHE